MLGRCVDFVEVARVVLFLASTDASFITGSDIPVDGGQTRRRRMRRRCRDTNEERRRYDTRTCMCARVSFGVAGYQQMTGERLGEESNFAGSSES
jgi:hypothetical protein